MSHPATSVPGTVASSHPGLRSLVTSALLSPDEASVLYHLTRLQLTDLVRDGRLRPLRDPIGRLCFANDDLAALPQEMPVVDAVAELTAAKEPTVESTSAAPATAGAGEDLVLEVRRLIDDVRNSLARDPKWLDIDAAIARFGVPLKTIKLWASNGFVRKSKLGPTFQSKTLYNAEDLDAVLNRIAAGKAPIVALREMR